MLYDELNVCYGMASVSMDMSCYDQDKSTCEKIDGCYHQLNLNYYS